METYLDAINEGVYNVAIVGFPEVKDKTKLSPTEKQYEKFNARARNILFRGLGKDVFN